MIACPSFIFCTRYPIKIFDNVLHAAIKMQTSHFLRQSILYTKVNSNAKSKPIIISCHSLLGSCIFDRSAVNHKQPKSRTIQQKSIKVTIPINKQSENICSLVLVLKCSLILFTFLCFPCLSFSKTRPPRSNPIYLLSHLLALF